MIDSAEYEEKKVNKEQGQKKIAAAWLQGLPF
jgi:hypothetical protein